ncbi:MAG: hypothetical protein K8R58_02660 [Bacteroidales bacterium]|nr:hypothetical protein [Bacteroidales bacterium]
MKDIILQKALNEIKDRTGFNIASDTAYSNYLSGLVDNILLTDLRDPIAQYPLNTGSGSFVFDSVSYNDGSIINGIWSPVD